MSSGQFVPSIKRAVRHRTLSSPSSCRKQAGGVGVSGVEIFQQRRGVCAAFCPAKVSQCGRCLHADTLPHSTLPSHFCPFAQTEQTLRLTLGPLTLTPFFFSLRFFNYIIILHFYNFLFSHDNLPNRKKQCFFFELWCARLRGTVRGAETFENSRPLHRFPLAASSSVFLTCL